MNLIEIVKAGELPALRQALEAGADTEARDEWGDTALNIASANNDRDAALALLDAGASLTHVSDYGFTPLAFALWNSYIVLAHILVERGALPSINDAACLGDLERLQREWDPMPDITQTIGPYLSACRCGQTAVVEWLLAQGMPVDLHPPGEEWGGIGCPGLHHAATHGHVDTVRLLLAHGADLTLVDDVHGTTALFWANMDGQSEVVEILREAGAK